MVFPLQRGARQVIEVVLMRVIVFNSLLFAVKFHRKYSADIIIKSKGNSWNAISEVFNTARNVAPTAFDTAGRLVLSTLPKDITGQDSLRTDQVKFHLRCVAESAALSDFHVVAHTADPLVIDHILDNYGSGGGDIEAHRIPPERQRDFTWMLRKMNELHPLAKGYGFFNGDVCATPSFVDAANEFFGAECPEGSGGGNTARARVNRTWRFVEVGGRRYRVDTAVNDVRARVNSTWRFVSGRRYNVDTVVDDVRAILNSSPSSDQPSNLRSSSSSSALEALLAYPREVYQMRGVDFFAWNAPMFKDHILSHPDFSLPLVSADHFLFEDGNCNSLTLLPEHGWKVPRGAGGEGRASGGNKNIMPAILMHIQHTKGNSMLTASTKGVNNRVQRAKANEAVWFNQNGSECQHLPFASENHCRYAFANGHFDCAGVGLCKSKRPTKETIIQETK